MDRDRPRVRRRARRVRVRALSGAPQEPGGAHAYPSDGDASYARFDVAVDEAARLALGAAGPGILSDTLASRRLRLPLSFGGGGLRSVFATMPAAFCGRLFAVASKLSAIAPKPTAAAFDGGETGDGFLAAPARWRSLLAGPSRLGSEVKSAWLKLTSESAHARRAASNAGEEPPNPGLLDATVERAGLKVTVDEGQSEPSYLEAGAHG